MMKRNVEINNSKVGKENRGPGVGKGDIVDREHKGCLTSASQLIHSFIPSVHGCIFLLGPPLHPPLDIPEFY